jgi:hypothetical protein
VFVLKPKNVTLAFKRLFSEASFIEQMIADFRFAGSPSCDLAFAFELKPKRFTLAFKLLFTKAGFSE